MGNDASTLSFISWPIELMIFDLVPVLASSRLQFVSIVHPNAGSGCVKSLSPQIGSNISGCISPDSGHHSVSGGTHLCFPTPDDRSRAGIVILDLN